MMSSKGFKVFVATAVGTLLGAIVAVALNPQYTAGGACIGAAMGGAIGVRHMSKPW